MRRVFAFAALAMLAACSGTDEKPFTDCRIGELTGTWKQHLDEIDGTCGKASDVTVILNPIAASDGGVDQNGCSTPIRSVSADKCRIDMQIACANKDGKSRFIYVLKHTAATQLTGSVQFENDDRVYGYCRSTYNVTWTQL